MPYEKRIHTDSQGRMKQKGGYRTRLKKQSILDDPIRFKRASGMGQRLGMSFTPTSQVTSPDQVSDAAKKEFGKSPNSKAQMERRKRLAASLQGRTTDSSRKRALARLMAQYGIQAK